MPFVTLSALHHGVCVAHLLLSDCLAEIRTKENVCYAIYAKLLTSTVFILKVGF